jgi:uncharacterized iron-regulated membrane protein
MKMNKFFRKVHRWLGLLMALQIIAWMASGLWFSIIPIEQIRGEHLTRPQEPLALSRIGALLRPAAVQQALDDHFGHPWELSSVELIRLGGAVYWRVSGLHLEQPFNRLVQTDSGQVLPMLSAAEAESQARAWLVTPMPPQSVEWIETVEQGSEIRGRDTPVWKVSFAQPESLNLYLDPWTGEILARRTDRWRIFDFFWMLHIMDFDAREDFNHPLLQISAALGLVIALSGVGLWAITSPILRRRRRHAS